MRTFLHARQTGVAKTLIAAAALAGLTGAACAAGADMHGSLATGIYSQTPGANPISGDLALYGGWVGLTTSAPGGDTKGNLFGGVGRMNIWIDPTMSAQIDLGAENTAESRYDNNYDVANFAGHLSYRSTPGHLVGVFGSLGYLGGPWGDRLGTVGFEGQISAGPVLLYGQAGYSDSFYAKDPYGGSTGLNALYVHGEARYFIKPNLMVSANLGYARANETGDESVGHDVWRWGADLEWKHGTSPFGAFISYQGAYQHEVSDTPVTGATVLAGLKIHFGGQTLQAESDSGATLKDFNPFTGSNQVRFFDWN